MTLKYKAFLVGFRKWLLKLKTPVPWVTTVVVGPCRTQPQPPPLVAHLEKYIAHCILCSVDLKQMSSALHCRVFCRWHSGITVCMLAVFVTPKFIYLKSVFGFNLSYSCCDLSLQRVHFSFCDHDFSSPRLLLCKYCTIWKATLI